MADSDRQQGPEFIRMLRQAGVASDDVRIAEMIWLSRFLTSSDEDSSLEMQVEEKIDRGGDRFQQGSETAPVATGPIETLSFAYRYEKSDAGVFRNTAAIESGKLRVSRRQIAGVPPLPDPASISRSLRPFQRRLINGRPGPIDEEATIDQVAESDLIIPVHAPTREKWFDAIVVFDDRPGMVVWRETIREFRHLLERHGAFRDARLWRLLFQTEKSGPILLSLSGVRRDLNAVNDPAGRRIVFLFSDGVSAVWRDGSMRDVVDLWGRRMPVVLVQVVNEEQWFRTAHGDPTAQVSSRQTGAPNKRLLSGSKKGGVLLPIVMPYQGSIVKWADMLMAGSGSVPALVLSKPNDVQQTSPPRAMTTEERIELLPSLLSDTALKLARYLSAVPLQIPIMRLVQRVMLPDSHIEHLAEVMLSGLIKRTNPEQDVSKYAEDEIDFEFADDHICAHLQQQLRLGELNIVISCISEFISERLGRRCDLRALIEDESGLECVPREALRFAEIAAQALAWHGIGSKSGRGEKIATRGAGWVNLYPFEFATLRLDSRGKEIKGSRRVLTARHFVEELSPSVSLDMVEIPSGTFQMGSPENEAERLNGEGPQHEVQVPSFYLGKFTITQSQWRIVAEWPSESQDLDPEPSYFKGVDHLPVEQVSWEDAKEFCARLAKKSGRAYRLPTEAEWEYSCRAGTITPFALGETITYEFVNFDSDYPYAKAPKKKYRGKTIPVGSLGVANDFGLFDMHGNVWEWCEDIWHSDYNGASADGSAWLSEGDSTRRVLRGGSFISYGWSCRSADRNYYDPQGRLYHFGFRVCVSAWIS